MRHTSNAPQRSGQSQMEPLLCKPLPRSHPSVGCPQTGNRPFSSGFTATPSLHGTASVVANRMRLTGPTLAFHSPPAPLTRPPHWASQAPQSCSSCGCTDCCRSSAGTPRYASLHAPSDIPIGSAAHPRARLIALPHDLRRLGGHQRVQSDLRSAGRWPPACRGFEVDNAPAGIDEVNDAAHGHARRWRHTFWY
jgi:hypothetical protein